MFGLSQHKKIDTERLIYNVSESILNIWSNPKQLPLEKFDSFTEYANIVRPKSATPARFFTEKLRFTTSVALSTLLKAKMSEEVSSKIIERVKQEASCIDHPDVKGASAGLGLKAREYTEIRFSIKPSEAGKLVGLRFSNEAFGFTPREDDTNRQYTLYKSLSSFERSTILEISTAIRNSRV